MSVVVLAGGTGGAKLARGMLDVVGPDELVVIANTGDDIDIYGAHVSPDPDLVSFWLADLIDERGWGLRGDTFAVMDALRKLGAEVWFALGDRDLAWCLERKRMEDEGLRPTEALARLNEAIGVRARVLPMCDEPLRTWVHTDEGWRDFQQFMIRERAEGAVRGGVRPLSRRRRRSTLASAAPTSPAPSHARGACGARQRPCGDRGTEQPGDLDLADPSRARGGARHALNARRVRQPSRRRRDRQGTHRSVPRGLRPPTQRRRRERLLRGRRTRPARRDPRRRSPSGPAERATRVATRHAHVRRTVAARTLRRARWSSPNRSRRSLSAFAG